MRESVEYCIEYKVRGETYYRKSFHGLKNKELALKTALNSSKNLSMGEIKKIRVVEQKRKIIRVFSL